MMHVPCLLASTGLLFLAESLRGANDQSTRNRPIPSTSARFGNYGLGFSLLSSSISSLPGPIGGQLDFEAFEA